MFRMIVIAVFCLSSAFGKENPEATAKYEKAIKQLKAGDLEVDFKGLRINCAASKYGCETDSEDRKAIGLLLNGKKFEEALTAANKAIEEAFVDIEMHYLTVYFNIDIPMKRLRDALQ